MKTQTQLRQEFIDFTINHFAENGYPGDNSYSVGCAIGIHLTKEKAKELDNVPGGSPVGLIFNRLPIALKKLGKHFLRDIQFWHDSRCTWNKFKELIPTKGKTFISIDGYEKMSYIKTKYNLI